MLASARKPTFAELFTPKLATVLHEGYRLPDLKADVMTGLTVAIVARLDAAEARRSDGVRARRRIAASIMA